MPSRSIRNGLRFSLKSYPPIQRNMLRGEHRVFVAIEHPVVPCSVDFVGKRCECLMAGSEAGCAVGVGFRSDFHSVLVGLNFKGSSRSQRPRSCRTTGDGKRLA